MLVNRRSAIFSSLVLLFLAAGCNDRPRRAAAPFQGSDWPQFLGPARDGVSPETGLASSWPATGPAVVWQRPVGVGFSGPVVAGGRLILFHRIADSEVVESLDAGTGAAQWRLDYPTAYRDAFHFDPGPRATPVIDGGRVYTLGAEGTLHCLDLDTGKKRWAHRLNDEYHPPAGFFGVGTTPLVEGNLVLVNVGAKGAGIVAFDRETGKEAWRATDDEASYSSPIAATVTGKRCAFFLTRAGLVALDPRTGRVAYTRPWRARIQASVNAATPVLADSRLFLSSSYGVGAILLRLTKDGAEEVWKADGVLSNHYATSIYHDGCLYGFDGRQEQGARLRCIDAQTGHVRWTQDRFGCGSMLLADGKLFILTEEGDLVLAAATPEAYREQARAHVLGPCRSPIALSGGNLYGRDTSRLVCWNVRP